MGLFDGIDKAQLSGKLPKLLDGFSGLLQVRRTVADESPKYGVSFIVEFEVIASNLVQHPVGQMVKWRQSMTDKTVAFPSVKNFVAALCGFGPGQKDQAEREINPIVTGLLNEACKTPDANDLVGCRVTVSVRKIKTKAGHDFMVHDWAPNTGDPAAAQNPLQASA